MSGKYKLSHSRATNNVAWLGSLLSPVGNVNTFCCTRQWKQRSAVHCSTPIVSCMPLSPNGGIMAYSTLYSVFADRYYGFSTRASCPLYYKCDAFRRTSIAVTVGQVVWC